MIPHRRQDLSAGSRFIFPSTTDPNGGAARHGPGTSPYSVVDLHGPWTDRTIGNSYGYSYGNGGDRKNPYSWTRRASFSHYDQGGNINQEKEEEEDLTWPVKFDENRSGTPSPQLWKNAGGGGGSPVTARSAGASPLRHSQAGQIARFRQEMMELVRDMPDESGYELSLRDMVQPPTPPRTTTAAAEAGEGKKEENKRMVKNHKAKQMGRSESMMNGGGLLLKMFTPAASMTGAGRRRRSSSGGGSNSFARVPPKPVAAPAAAAANGEWWRKNELSGSSGGSSSSSSSKSSGSGSSERRGWIKGGCYSFLLRTQHGAEEI